MLNDFISRKNLLRMSLISGIFLVLSTVQFIITPVTRVVFCDIGQGDGIYIRTKENLDILVDAGPSDSMLECLGRHMPFYDRTIDIAFLTHPHDDHYGGYNSIIGRYKIKTFIAVPVENEAKSYQRLVKKLTDEKIPIDYLFKNDRIELGSGAEIVFFWPTQQFIKQNPHFDDPNEYSQVFLFSEGETDILFTGDVPPPVLTELLVSPGLHERKIEILKLPHHGSRNGITREFLDLIDPELSIISVGRKNSFHHPSPEIIDMLNTTGHKFLSTAKAGDIVMQITDDGWEQR